MASTVFVGIDGGTATFSGASCKNDEDPVPFRFSNGSKTYPSVAVYEVKSGVEGSNKIVVHTGHAALDLKSPNVLREVRLHRQERSIDLDRLFFADSLPVF